MTLMAPKDEGELRDMLFTALKQPGPVAIRYPRGKGLGVPIEPCYTEIPIGKAELLRPGRDLLIIALGSMVAPSVEAAAVLEEEGLSVGVVNCRFVKPLDRGIIDQAREAGRVLSVEENIRQGGLGGAVLELFCDTDVHDVPVRRMGLPDRFVEQGPVDLLRERCGLDASGIVKEARDFCRQG